MQQPFLEAITEKKESGTPIVMLTAYDAPFAALLDESGEIDLILVGDSLGMVVQGKASTREVTMEQMCYHVEMVARSVSLSPVIGDLPYHSFETPQEARKNARMLTEAGASAVKFEGGNTEVTSAILEEGIPVMGHLGLLPQTADSYRVIGKEPEEAEGIIRDAKHLEESGIFSLVLEGIPRSLALDVTRTLTIPTIGIGAGPDCDGQVLVTYDMLGLTGGKVPKFVKQYADLGDRIKNAVSLYAEEVRKRDFPSDRFSYH